MHLTQNEQRSQWMGIDTALHKPHSVVMLLGACMQVCLWACVRCLLPFTFMSGYVHFNSFASFDTFMFRNCFLLTSVNNMNSE